MSRKDERIAELERQLKAALAAVGGAQAQIAGLLAQVTERDAAFGPLRDECDVLRMENTRLRREFKGFLDSITFWKGEL